MSENHKDHPHQAEGHTGTNIVNDRIHLRSLLWKNWMLKKRRYISTTVEIFLPVLLILILSILRHLSKDVMVPSGWSDANPLDPNSTVGKAYSLFDPYGLNVKSLDLVTVKKVSIPKNTTKGNAPATSGTATNKTLDLSSSNTTENPAPVGGKNNTAKGNANSNMTNTDLTSITSDSTNSTIITNGTTTPLSGNGNYNNNNDKSNKNSATRANKYVVAETSLSGLLFLLASKSAVETVYSNGWNDTERFECQTSVAFFGQVNMNGTDNIPSSIMPPLCQDKIIPYKIAIVPDTPFTRKYFFETIKNWYPRVTLTSPFPEQNDQSNNNTNSDSNNATANDNSTNTDTNTSTAALTIPSLEDSVVFFTSEEALESYVQDGNYGKRLGQPRIYGAIVFDQVPEEIGTFGSIEFSIRMNSTSSSFGAMGSVPRTLGSPPFDAPYRRQIDTGSYMRYTIRGFATLQTLVVRFLNCMPLWDPITQEVFPFTCQRPDAMANATEEIDFLLLKALSRDIYLSSTILNALDVVPSLLTSKQKKQFQEKLVLVQLEAEARSLQDVPLSIWTFLANLDPIEKEKLFFPLRLMPQSIVAQTVSPFPIHGFRSSPFYSMVKKLFAMLFIMANLYGLSRWIVALILEKETRTREYLKILGVKEKVILLSWFVTYGFLFCILSSLFQTIVCKVGLFQNSNFLLILIFFFLFNWTILSYGFMISSLFQRSRTGSFVGMIVFFLMYFVSRAFTTESTTNDMIFASFLPPVAFAFGIDVLVLAESSNVGITFANLSVMVDNYTLSIALWMLLLDAIMYGLLGWYLDQVVPRENGITKKWYYPLQELWNLISYVASWIRTSPSSSQVQDQEKESHQQKTMPLNDEQENPNIELLQDKTPALIVKNISKAFEVPGGTKMALNNVSLTMYQDQITCLLGKNGAGKTTLIHLLTGILSPTGTQGDAFFQGLSFRTQMNQIRQSLGLCFQHNVLYDDLTVEEHLIFFAKLKGYKNTSKFSSSPTKLKVSNSHQHNTSALSMHEMIAEKIGLVGLKEKKKTLTCHLSGGMKRKLSLAIALLGNNALVFLDEPTSGMDPYSRRSIWEILMNNRLGRVMVLTTHFMDEADLLGDRIAIMAEGQVRCCGSSLFLKKRFGAGYTLTFVVQSTSTSTAKNSKLIEFISSTIPSAQLLSHVGSEISFQLPSHSSGCFASMFELFEEDLDAFGISSFGISVTTMEEVFLKVSETAEGLVPPPPPQVEATSATPVNQICKPTSSSPKDTPDSPPIRPSLSTSMSSKTFLIQICALFLKRFRIARRDRKVHLFSALLPVILLIGGMLILKLSTLSANDIKLPLSSDPFLEGDEMPVPYYCMNDINGDCDTMMETFYDGGIPVPLLENGMTEAYNTTTPVVFNLSYNATPIQSNGGSGYLLRLSEAIFDRAFGEDGAKTNEIIPGQQHGGYLIQTIKNESSGATIVGYNTLVNTTSAHGSVIFQALMNQALYRYSATSNNTDPIGALADANANSSFESVPIYLQVNTYPLPLTATSRILFDSYASFVACLFIVIAFSFFPASIVVFLVKEKQAQHNAKHQQLVSGVSIFAFWISNYLWDFIMYLIPFSAALILIQAFDVTVLTGNNCVTCTHDTFSAVVWLFVLFGVAICPFTYVMTFFFKEHTNAQTYAIMINFIIGVGFLAISFILDNTSSQLINQYLKFLYRLSPLYCLGNGLLNLSLQEMQAELINATAAANISDPSTDMISLLDSGDGSGSLGDMLSDSMSDSMSFSMSDSMGESMSGSLFDDTSFNEMFTNMTNITTSSYFNVTSPYDLDIMGYEMIYLIWTTVFFLAITIGVDSLSHFPKLRAEWSLFRRSVQAQKCEVEGGKDEEDIDVRNERKRVLQGSTKRDNALPSSATQAEENDAVSVQNISKTYSQGKKMALKDLSFGLKKGDCFGYLGINGAGKTTTMKILTGDLVPTSGTAELGGVDILTHPFVVRQLIGYCPQFDALFDLLTVREHLELFAQIKGIQNHKELSSVVYAMMNQLNLMAFENKLAGTLSGGNKRKLSVAMALIGAPPIVFLDEPSTGMDPVSRRYMWNVISNLSTQKKQSTIILTTHSMEECEALCSKVGIMVGGRLKCFGSIQHLKSRFGDGLMLEIKLETPSIHEINQRLDQLNAATSNTTCTTIEQLSQQCGVMGNLSWKEKLTIHHPTGYTLVNALERDRHVRLDNFIAWWLTEEKFLALDSYLKECFVPSSTSSSQEHTIYSLQLIERQNDFCRYKLSNSSVTWKLSSVFRFLEEAKTQYGIREYAVSQTTLEQIFNTFAAKQQEETRIARGINQ